MKKIIAISALACAAGSSLWNGVRTAGADGLYISVGVGNTEAAAGPLGSRNTTIDATALNQTFTLQVFADVYGNDADGNNDGLQELNFSLVNAATGTTGTSVSPFRAAAPFNSPLQPGAAFSVVTNGVTNVNRGAPNGSLVTNYIFSRAPTLQVNEVAAAQNAFFGSSGSLPGTSISNANGNGSEFYLGSVTVTVTHLGSDTTFSAIPRLAGNGSPDSVSALWTEDAQFALNAEGIPRFTTMTSNPPKSPFESGAPISIVDVVGDFTWSGAAGKTWDATSSNWTNASAIKAYSNSADRANPNTAIFNLGTPGSISVNGKFDVGNILFTTGGWTLNQGGSGGGNLAYGASGALVITTAAGADTINLPIVDGSLYAAAGGVTSVLKLGAGTLTLGGAMTSPGSSYTGGTTISAGTLIAAAGGLGVGPVINNATLEVTVNSSASQITGTGNTTVASGTLGAGSIVQGTLTVNGTVSLLPSPLVAGSGNLNPYASTSVVRVLTIAGGAAPTGTINLNNNALIIAGGGSAARDAAQTDVAYARNGGLWNRPGITSSNAKTAFAATSFDSRTLGVVLNGDLPTPYTSFGGQPVYPTDVLIAFTYGGDADLNGAINGNDYFQIDRGFLNHYTGWVNGDFNYDGIINGNDYFIIDSNFIDQSGQLAAAEVLDHAAEFGPSYLSQFTPTQLAAIGVPEPASLALFGLGLLTLIKRRR